ncbi:hypothetical protein AJ85_20690 [Alkalihalobacillus alcalophilus ATCC 27647 = CGMCC 1.3604]|uniref:NADP-dependent oxidoreductase domain-containing protein n=1 Tax=Alkalihalobacillus alcalophilus ATCC 27647 = CGMCC 1.3604 TaxID=1218173 RepID=A0A4S4JX50_ALKAL|nr:hypothetical protein AJ85_20690 [Alkalihalobacillus alcalophilus ATCC 27647 = CGMCC 1.3604]
MAYRAGLDYYDLYLIHWPNPKQNKYVEAWQALIDLKKSGLIRSIGVCNFLPEHIERLEQETAVKPSLNQIELHPYFNQKEQREWHLKNEIQTQSWSPLSRANALFQEETLLNLAAEYKKSPSQIILRWHYQLGSIAIPKSANRERQLENISIFDFSSEADMIAIVILERFDRVLKEIINTVLVRAFGEQIEHTKFDLVYCVNGFIGMYSKLFLYYRIPIDLEALAHSLVEKTEILAKHVQVPFLTFDLDQFFKDKGTVEVTPEQLVALIEQKKTGLDDSIEKESLSLLQEQLSNHPNYSKAIIKGLCENIRLHPECKDLFYLLRIYFEF